MSDAYGHILVDLRREIDTAGARPAAIDVAVNELLTCGDERLPSDLLSLLSDGAEYDEGMFSLIHAAESYDNEAYVRALLSVFPHTILAAPRWASIVLMRVLNSASTRTEMVRQLPDAPSPVKEAVRDMCDRINDLSPQFVNRTMQLTLAAS